LKKRKEVIVGFMDLEKAYDRVSRLTMWEVLMINGVGDKIPRAIKSMFEERMVFV
jgi:hypothetical protein